MSNFSFKPSVMFLTYTSNVGATCHVTEPFAINPLKKKKSKSLKGISTFVKKALIRVGQKRATHTLLFNVCFL